MMSACAAGHAECVRVLLKAGADPFKEFRVAYTRRITQGLRMTDNACECAFDSGHREVVGILRETPEYPTSRFAVDPRCAMQGTPPSSPDKLRSSKRAKPTKPQRTTPMRDRAEKAGVSDKMRATPPGVRELIIAAGPDSSSPVRRAKLQLQLQRALCAPRGRQKQGQGQMCWWLAMGQSPREGSPPSGLAALSGELKSSGCSHFVRMAAVRRRPGKSGCL